MTIEILEIIFFLQLNFDCSPRIDSCNLILAYLTARHVDSMLSHVMYPIIIIIDNTSCYNNTAWWGSCVISDLYRQTILKWRHMYVRQEMI